MYRHSLMSQSTTHFSHYSFHSQEDDLFNYKKFFGPDYLLSVVSLSCDIHKNTFSISVLVPFVIGKYASHFTCYHRHHHHHYHHHHQQQKQHNIKNNKFDAPTYIVLSRHSIGKNIIFHSLPFYIIMQKRMAKAY
jgi:hypothetical protein